MNKQLTGVGKNKPLLLEFAGYDTIYDAKREFEGTAKQFYEIQLGLYNERVREIQKADKKAKREAEKLKAAKNVIVNITGKTFRGNPNEVMISIMKLNDKIISKLKPLIGKPICYLQLTYNKDNIEVSEMIKIKDKNISSIFYNSINPLLIEGDGSDGSKSRFIYNGSSTENMQGMIDKGFITEQEYIKNFANDEDTKETFRLVITTDTEIPSEKIKQSFRDGEVHCVIEPLYNLWFKMSENSSSPASKKRCMQIANKIKQLEEIYPNGVPEDKMDEVAKVASRCIVLHDIIGNVICKYNESSSKNFHFTNTRKNHIDTGFITLNEKYENVSVDELNEIIKKSEWGLFGGDFRSPQSFSTTEGSYAIYNEEYELFNEFSKSLNIRNYSINAVKLPSLNQFILESRVINSAPVALCNTPNELDGIKHADIVSAYTQHSKCPYYMGFLGKIHQFCKGKFDKTFIALHVGIYKMKVIECNNELYMLLGIKVGFNYTLTSPEALKMMDSGIEFEIFAGCWGHTFTFEYTPEMLENRNYCTWAGKLGMENEYNTYSFKGNAEWASHLKHELGTDNVFYFQEMQMILIRVKRLSYTTTHHILAFITAYTRINMIEMMEQVDGELVKVILDGIYYTGTLGEVSVPYKPKEVKTHLGFGEGWYFPSVVDTNDWAEYDSRFDGNCVLAAPGGFGKSHSIFNHKGFTDVLYVVPSHMLGGDKHYCTIHRLIGFECQSYRELYKVPSVIFIDELTMIEESWIEKAIKMYPESQIIIGGDIDEKQWFQCRNGYCGNFSKIWLGKGWRFVKYDTDYRSLDNELKVLKQDVRNEMKRIFTGQDIDTTYMRMYIKKRCKTIKFDEAVAMTNENDIWIAGTHKTEKMLKDKGVSCNYKGETKPSFTIHSFQGQTIEDARVFIRLDLFEYAMLYTAISRVRRMSQIILVE